MGVALALWAVSAAPASAALKFGSNCGETPFQCTHVKVPIDRSGGVKGKIPLYVERSPGGGKDAIFAIAGGPGQGASTLDIPLNNDLGTVLNKGRYLVVVDQRGTGRSGALNCPELERETKRPLDVRAAACATRLGPKRAFYTTRDAVDDLEAVRQRLGQDRITLYGVSYGTKVAEAYALSYPQHVKRLILDSVVEPEGQSSFDLDSFAAMPRVMREICRGECRGVTSNLPGDLAKLARRLRAAPLRGPWVGPRGRRRTVRITARQLYEQMRSGDLDPGIRAEYPGAIRSALDGDPAPLLRMEHRFDALPASKVKPPPDAVRALSFSMFTANSCEELPLPWARTAAPGADRLRQARQRAAAIPDSAFAPFGRQVSLALDSNSILLNCLRWPALPVAPALGPGPLPDVPVLVLEGREDLRTPLEVGARMAARFPHATLFAVPKTAHAVLGRGAPCAGTALARWFAGKAVGTPCRKARRAIAVRAKIPARLGAVAPAPRTRSTPGRTLAAGLLTLQDLYREYDAIGFLLDHPAGGGLRGGFYRGRGSKLRLRRFTLVPGVTLSGTIGTDKPVGRLRIAGKAAAAGTLTISRRGKVSGRLGGRRVAGHFRRPTVPGT